MATYDELVGRIEVATVKLEQDVTDLTTYVAGIEDATNGAVGEQVQEAKDAATAAKQSAVDAKASADAIAAINPVTDAPMTGSTYGRNNGDWVLVESGGGGVGTVVSVNGVGPDAGGNVQIAIPTKTSELANDSNFATTSQLPTLTSQLTNDSAFITESGVAVKEAPVDGKQYARKDGDWSVVEAGGEAWKYVANKNQPKYTISRAVYKFRNKIGQSGSQGMTQADWLELQDSWTEPMNGAPEISSNSFELLDIRVLAVTNGSGNTPVFTHSVTYDTSQGLGWQWTTSGNFLFDLLNNVSTVGGPTDSLWKDLKQTIPVGRWCFQFPALPSGSHGLPSALRNQLVILEVSEIPRSLTGNSASSTDRRLLLTGVGNTATAAAYSYAWCPVAKAWAKTIS